VATNSNTKPIKGKKKDNLDDLKKEVELVSI
jgi:hypothetical protein